MNVLRRTHRWTATVAVALAAIAVVAGAPSLAPALAASASCPGAHAPVARLGPARARHAVLCLLNQRRRGFGLPALRDSRALDRAAQGWTATMIAERYFGHGSELGARLTAAGFDWSRAGENVATGYATPAAVVKGWMASRGHCANILDPGFRYAGGGASALAIGGYGTGAGTWTEDFGLLLGQRAPSANRAPASGCPYR